MSTYIKTITVNLARYYRKILAVTDRYTDKDTDTNVHFIRIQIPIRIQKHTVSALAHSSFLLCHAHKQTP